MIIPRISHFITSAAVKIFQFALLLVNILHYISSWQASGTICRILLIISYSMVFLLSAHTTSLTSNTVSVTKYHHQTLTQFSFLHFPKHIMNHIKIRRTLLITFFSWKNSVCREWLRSNGVVKMKFVSVKQKNTKQLFQIILSWKSLNYTNLTSIVQTQRCEFIKEKCMYS
jgi:hypothetical protein